MSALIYKQDQIIPIPGLYIVVISKILPDFYGFIISLFKFPDPIFQGLFVDMSVSVLPWVSGRKEDNFRGAAQTVNKVIRSLWAKSLFKIY